jgi:hypothetical protein
MKNLSIKEKIKISLSLICSLLIALTLIKWAIEADENYIKKQASYKEFVESGELKDSLDLFVLDSIGYENTIEKLIEIIENTEDTIVKKIAIDYRVNFYMLNIAREEEKAKKEQEEKEAKIKKAKKKVKNLVRGKTDEFTNITWYKNKRFTHYIDYSRISLYIGHDNNDSWVRLKISYSGDDWIFFENISLLYGESNVLNLDFGYFSEKETKVLGGGEVAEWIDIAVSPRELKYLKEFAKSNNSKIKFSGDAYFHKMTVGPTQKKAMLEVIEAYEILKSIN